MSKSYTSYRLRHLLKVSSRATVLLRFDPPPPPSFFPAPRKNSMCIYIYRKDARNVYTNEKVSSQGGIPWEGRGGGLRLEESIRNARFLEFISWRVLFVYSFQSDPLILRSSYHYCFEKTRPRPIRVFAIGCRSKFAVFFHRPSFCTISLSHSIYIYIEERVQSALILSHGQA